jgi:hypothetical protein
MVMLLSPAEFYRHVQPLKSRIQLLLIFQYSLYLRFVPASLGLVLNGSGSIIVLVTH